MKVTIIVACISLMVIGFVFAGQLGQINPDDIAAVWLFDEGSGDKLIDSEGQGIDGTIEGATWVDGLNGKALQFDGVDDVVNVPDSTHINTGGPYTDRTVMALFNCKDVSITDHKQTIFEEGGRTRGAVIYVHGGNLYVAAWNRAEYNWDGAWPSVPIESNKWYYVAFVIRDGGSGVEPDKFEMWLNGRLIAKEPGGQLHGHSNDNAIGATIENVVFHDDDGSGNGNYFGGIIDEVRIYNAALSADDMSIMVAVEPQSKMASLWGELKSK